jgi:MFS transporter, DHA3 family, macrolide efflux protein
MHGWQRKFFLIWGGQAVSLVGSGLVQFALVWWLTQTTGSAAVLAGATLAALLPNVFLGPFAGALVDRLNRKKVMILADTATAAATCVLVALFATGVIQPWHVFVILFIRSVCGSFQFPAMQASTSLMVPHAHLARVAGLNQLLNGILGIATPPLGALLLSLLPMYGVLSVDVVTAMTAVIPLLLVSIPQPDSSSAGAVITPKSLLLDVREGLRYVRIRPGLIAILIMATLINFLFNPAGMLVPLLVTQLFQGGAWHLSLLESAFGIGVIGGSLVLSAWGGFKRQIATTMLGLIGMGVGAFVVGMTPGTIFGMAVGGYVLVGIMIPLANGPLQALMQTRVEPGMQGRVMTLVGSCANAMTPVGMVLAAPISNWLGIQAWFLAAGVVTFCVGVLGYFLPVVMHIEDDMPLAVPAPAPALTPAEN